MEQERNILVRAYLLGLKGFFRECLDPDGDEEQIRRDLDNLTNQAERLELGPADILRLVHAALQGCDGTCEQCPEGGHCVHQRDPKLIALRRRLTAVINGIDVISEPRAGDARVGEIIPFGEYQEDRLRLEPSLEEVEEMADEVCEDIDRQIALRRRRS